MSEKKTKPPAKRKSTAGPSVQDDFRIIILLADHAQVHDGKLYLMGGGWEVFGPEPMPFSIAIKFMVPWSETNRRHDWRIDLVTQDGTPAMIQTPIGPKAVRIEGQIEVGRPVGVHAGTMLGNPLAINLPPLPLEPGDRYVWQFYINEKTRDEWSAAFSVRERQHN